MSKPAKQDRWYQIEAVEKTTALMDGNPSAHPLIVMPTGSGKSHTMCMFVDAHLTKKPADNILILSHVAEILEQDHEALSDFFDIDIGLYSAGLGERDIKKITVASIQTVYNNPEKFKHFNIVIIDECHRIPINNNSMYRKFLSELNAVYIGLTATNFRLGHGYIHEGEGALFTDIAYDLSEYEAFNRLVDEGFLSKLITKKTIEQLNTDGLKKTGGDFNVKAMVDRFDRSEITNSAVSEIIKFGKNFKRWLIFTIDIDHAEHVADELCRNGISTACIHSKMGEDRKQVIKDAKDGKYRAVVNVDILTTGYDDPNIDLIVLLRPTESPSLHIQMIGRGLRVVYAPGFDLDTIEGRLNAIKASNKQACLVLDFAGNTERLGPINDVKVKQKGKSQGGEPITKECPGCGVIHHPSVRTCDICGHEFVFKEKISTSATTADVVKNSSNIKQWVDVAGVSYSIHQKAGSPSSLRVTYNVGFVSFSEWICYDHDGFAGRKARHWVKWRWIGVAGMPDDLSGLYKNTDLLMKPKQILVNNSGKFPSIDDYSF
jgi:DNA repair protein RadD